MVVGCPPLPSAGHSEVNRLFGSIRVHASGDRIRWMTVAHQGLPARDQLLVVGVVVVAVIAGGVGYSLYQSSRAPEGSADQFLRRPRPTDKRVAVMLGDSTFHGRVGIDAMPTVRERLPDWEIVNAGHNGDTSADLLARVEPVLTCKPDAMVVEAGGNDALQDHSVEEFRRDLAALLDRVQPSVTNVGLCSFQVAGDDPSTAFNRRVSEYALVMRSLATERRLAYLPLRERMTAELGANPGGAAWNKNMTVVARSILERHLLRRSVDEQSRRRRFMFNPDGLHLNTRGSGLLSDVIVEYLRTIA
jgi:lysophospholipase L1-like esterase